MIENENDDDDVENQIKELKEKIDLEIIKDIPDEQDLCDWITEIVELISSSSTRDDDVPMFYIEEIRTMCDVVNSNCSDEAKAHYKEYLQYFVSFDDYQENDLLKAQYTIILDIFNSAGIHLEEEQEESSLAGNNDATYDQEIPE